MSGRRSLSTRMHTKRSARMRSTRGSASTVSCSSRHQRHHAARTNRRTGTPRARACAKASSLQSDQSMAIQARSCERGFQGKLARERAGARTSSRSLHLGRELRQLVEAELLLDAGHLVDHPLEAVLAEQLVLPALEVVAQRV